MTAVWWLHRAVPIVILSVLACHDPVQSDDSAPLEAGQDGRSPPARFWNLGDLPGSITESYAYDISSAGDVISGESFSSLSQVHGEGVYWKRVSAETWQMTGIGMPSADALNSAASGVAGNGRWIVGRASFGPPTAPAIDTDAYRWSPTYGFEWLGLPAGFVVAAATGVNASGSVIAGYGGPNPNYSGLRALVWTPAEPGWRVSFLESTYESRAFRIDLSGRFVVGLGNSPAAEEAGGSAGQEAVLWVREPGGSVRRVWLGASRLTPFYSGAVAIVHNRAGLLIGGFSGLFPLTQLPVVWTLADRHTPQLAELPLLPGFTGGGVNGISANGRRIVGTCLRMVEGYSDTDTCIWEEGRVSSLKQRLLAAGVESVEDWTLVAPAAISAEGTVIAGIGYAPSGDILAWAAELP